MQGESESSHARGLPVRNRHIWLASAGRQQLMITSEEQQTGREGLALIISYSRCSARFVNEHNGGLSALASLVVAAFTFTLWLIASSQFRHARDIDRAYASGGGPGNPPNGPFILTINNYGRTPGTLIEYAVEFCELTSIPSRPKYLARDYTRTRSSGIYPPTAHGWDVAQIPYADKQLHEPVVAVFQPLDYRSGCASCWWPATSRVWLPGTLQNRYSPRWFRPG